MQTDSNERVSLDYDRSQGFLDFKLANILSTNITWLDTLLLILS